MDVKKITEPLYKIYNFVVREFAYTQQVEMSGQYLPFGPDDMFPNKLAALVQGSPTATACLSTMVDFVTGEGFNKGIGLENLVINNQGLKLFRYHSIQSDSLVHNWGVASIVKYNQAGEITQIFDIPFAYCRLGKPDDRGIISKILYNPYFGTGLYNKAQTIEYDVYNPTAATVQMGLDKKWKGQINWLGIKDQKHPFYPIPDYYSASHWMNVEKNAAVYFDTNLENGFLQSMVLKMVGDPNDVSGKKDGNDEDITKGKLLDEMLTKDFSGPKRAHKIMTLWGNNKEEWPELAAFPTNANSDLYRVQDEQATRKISIATKVPAILANVNDANNFGGEQIRPAVKLMQQRAKRPQDLLIDYYSDMLKRFINPVTVPIKIVPYNPFPELESIDPQVWGVMTLEEQRKWTQDHTEIELTITTPQTPAAPVENRFVNLHFDSYPAGAKANAKRAVDWEEKMQTFCQPKKGRMLTDAILNGIPLGPKEIKRLSRYLSKNTIHKDKPYGESCEAVMYDAWGGSEMMVWANEKVKELNGKAD